MADSPVFLIVQPNRALCRQLENWLKGVIPDASIFTAQTGVQALRLAAEKVPGVCLVELQLRDQNGLKVIQQLHKVVPAARILATSFFEGRAYQVDAFTAGAVGFIVHSRLYLDLLPLLQINGNSSKEPSP